MSGIVSQSREQEKELSSESQEVKVQVRGVRLKQVINVIELICFSKRQGYVGK